MPSTFTLTPHVTVREDKRRAALTYLDSYLRFGYRSNLEAAIGLARSIGVEAPDGINAGELQLRLLCVAK